MIALASGLVAVTLLGAVPVEVQGVARAPGPDATLAPILRITIQEAGVLPLGVRRIMLPAPDKPGDPKYLVLRTVEPKPVELARLALLAPGPDGPARYEWSGKPTTLKVSALELAAPVDSTFTRLLFMRKLSRTLQLELATPGSSDPIIVQLKPKKRPQGFDPGREAERPAQEWAAASEAITASDAGGNYALARGHWRLDGDFVVPRGVTLTVPAGTTFSLAPGRSIFAYGRLIFAGTAEAPITVQRAGIAPWGTVAMVGPGSTGSRFSHVRFNGGAGWFIGVTDVPGTVAILDGEASFEDCRFEKVLSEDALHVKRSQVTLRRTRFTDTASDGVDLEAASATAEDCVFERIGDDAWDIGEGSAADLQRMVIRRALGKAMSVGQRSNATMRQSYMMDGGRGVSSFEGSTALIEDSLIAFMTRSAVQAAARKGTEPGRSLLTRTLLWQNAMPKGLKNARIVLKDVRLDVPVDMTEFTPIQGAGPQSPPVILEVLPGPSNEPAIVLVAARPEDAEVAGAPMSGQWGFIFLSACGLLVLLLLAERKLRI